MKKVLRLFPMMTMLLLFFLTVFSVKVFAWSVIPPNFTDEPPTNPFIADSPWPMSHRNPYCQASSPYPGPKSISLTTTSSFNVGMPGLITLAISGKYPDGKRVIWGSSSTAVFKADEALHYIKTMNKENLTISSVFSTDEMLSGAYTLVDKNNIFYMPRFTKIFAFGDAVAGNRYSDIVIKGKYEIPANMLVDPAEKIVGLSMTWDGMLVFATSHGLVGVVSRNFDEAFYYRFPAGEQNSNSIACDENGGIYVVTDKNMYRVQWTGSELTIDPAHGGWSAGYETGEGSGVRLGAGSGSTPTLMGTGNQDKFVVITDGQDLMHLVFFWRDEIPADWQQIPGTESRRIAAQVPVTFGDPSATETLSEQSVCVRGYGTAVVNNQLKASFNNQAISVLMSGFAPIAPYGVEKFVWDPQTRTLKTAWVNKSVSMPNGIPSMSQATNLFYGVGQKWGAWTFEALNWTTGKSVFSYPYGITPANNSAYAATEIGLDGSLYTGTLMGMVRMK
ncbi:MAG: hypothetical protein NTW65_08965 [Deltaproteobacteria bacterium]|nr:hypothetical protein [Deltaproteobacteria bacterium]